MARYVESMRENEGTNCLSVNGSRWPALSGEKHSDPRRRGERRGSPCEAFEGSWKLGSPPAAVAFEQFLLQDSFHAEFRLIWRVTPFHGGTRFRFEIGDFSGATTQSSNGRQCRCRPRSRNRCAKQRDSNVLGCASRTFSSCGARDGSVGDGICRSLAA